MQKKDLTEMPILMAIITLATPLILTNILFTMYQIIDAFWVGQLGKEAVAAVSISFPIFFLVNAAVMGFSSAGAILISQYHGKNETHNINFIAGQTISLLTVMGIIIGILGYILSPQIISIFGVEKEVSALASEYLAIVFIGLIPMFFYTAFSSILRGVGEVKFPLYVTLITVVLNFILDPVLMLGLFGFPKMGVGGVAWATTITQLLSAIIALIWIGKYDNLVRINKEDLILKKHAIKRLSKLGIPSMIEFLSRSIGMLLITGIVSAFGTVAIAAYGIGMRIASFALIPSLGISLAINTLVGQNLGAKKVEKANKTTMKGAVITFIFLAIIGAVLFVYSNELSAIFIANDPVVVSESGAFTKALALTYCFLGAQIAIIAAYRGAGKTKTAMNLSIIYIVLQTALCYYFGTIMGLNGVWVGYSVSNALIFFMVLIYYLRNPLKESIVH
jgi:putative MATE family efflux protein